MVTLRFLSNETLQLMYYNPTRDEKYNLWKVLTEVSELDSRQGQEIFSSAQRPTGFGVHSASYAMGTSGYLPMGRAVGLS